MKGAPTRRETFQFAAGGIIYGFIVFVLAFLMTGAGHGWMSGVYSAPAIFFIPFFGVAIANRNRTRGLVYGGIAFFGMLLVDYLIIRAAIDERPGYFEKAMPVSALWLILWAAWQVGVLWLLWIVVRNLWSQSKRNP